jgi:CRISPR system Cascade subunit CasE
MYLSRLTLNPDPRVRTVRRDLASPYEMHRTLMRAFSEKGEGRVLFRLEPMRRDEAPVVLVQSPTQPDWEPLERMKTYLANVETRAFEPVLAEEMRLRFRLRANPTRKVGTGGKGPPGSGESGGNGRREALLHEQDQRAWLDRKAQAGGFGIDDCVVIPEDSPHSMRKGVKEEAGEKHTLTLFSVRYEGVLRVTEPEEFASTLARGIGPAKAMGFGLLSLAPAC